MLNKGLLLLSNKAVMYEGKLTLTFRELYTGMPPITFLTETESIVVNSPEMSQVVIPVNIGSQISVQYAGNMIGLIVSSKLSCTYEYHPDIITVEDVPAYMTLTIQAY